MKESCENCGLEPGMTDHKTVMELIIQNDECIHDGYLCCFHSAHEKVKCWRPRELTKKEALGLLERFAKDVAYYEADQRKIVTGIRSFSVVRADIDKLRAYIERTQ